ncbi:Integral membrane protein hemolysin-III-like protein [Quillaja saponaria]|uniref:Integral membrane protein hemolysin-III-like protein n=1 Tax=Quillaja saponaria TaxID=32244 RepID=A0AAD7VKC0_QUISA|nr:Integral membrane protein hemolysin-III-like protein [Quillaja saponaria]
MVQQSIESKFCEYGLGNSDTDFLKCDEQLPLAVKKTPLRDLQNDNRMTVPKPNANSSFLKERVPINDTRVSGTKRPSPECPGDPDYQQSPGNSAANGRLVYVRRKSEAELGKRSTCGSLNINAHCPYSMEIGAEETAQPKTHLKETKVSCFPPFSPFPMASSMSSSGKHSVSLSFAKSAMPATRFAPAESNFPTASAVPAFDNPKGLKFLHWEERYHQLQMLLVKLDQSDQEDYIQMLRSVSSVELSRHAVELEKRSIQLSLEEAKELQRVGVLNVLGKPVKNFKAPTDHQDISGK